MKGTKEAKGTQEQKEGRKPSYIPARTFALTLLNVAGVSRPAAGAGGVDLGAVGNADLKRILEVLRNDSALDVTEFANTNVAALLGTANVPQPVRDRLQEVLAGAQGEFEKLHDSVEVWFNNAMDRVSGTYKRYTQLLLFLIGLGVAILMDADTVRIWRTLATNDKLREGLAAQAAATHEAMTRYQAGDSAGIAQGDTSLAAVLVRGLKAKRGANQDSAAQLYKTSLASLDSTGLDFGWTNEEAAKLGIRKQVPSIDTVPPQPGAGPGAPLRIVKSTSWETRWWPLQWYAVPFWTKVFGLLLTAIAISLGAQFWFDTLNKLINLRSAGRAPNEKARSPEAAGKRPAEVEAK